MHIQEEAFTKINEAFRHLPPLPSQARNLPKYGVWSELPPGMSDDGADPAHPVQKFPGRKVGIGACLVVLVALGIAASVRTISSHKEVALSESRIGLEEVKLENLEAKRSSRDGTYHVTARVQNLSSAHTLGSFSLSLKMIDRIGSDSADVVGEETASIQVAVPPGQVRGISEDVTFASLPAPRGNYEWSHVITQVHAR
ncbi:MAG: hypothetical protein JWL90_4620 [Chthoniobacteraceae bacterium]|nr:hypothetical protein [Chthoniobacteraceae bacterium]